MFSHLAFSEYQALHLELVMESRSWEGSSFSHRLKQIRRRMNKLCQERGLIHIVFPRIKAQGVYLKTRNFRGPFFRQWKNVFSP